MNDWEAMSYITVVHISDIHIKSDKDKTLSLFEHLPVAICREVVKSELILLLISGDLAYAGSEEEYIAIESALSELEGALSKQLATPIKWLLVPGNHDGTFKDAPKSRAHVIAGILKEGADSIDESVIETCVAPQRNYFAMEEKFCSAEDYSFKDKLLGVKDFKVGEKTVQFWELNASWMSRIPELQGSLVFPIARYQTQLQSNADYRFAILHHPLNWYAQDSYHALRKTLVTNFCGVFSGHEHVSNGHIQKSLTHDNHCLFMEAGALGPHDSKEVPTFTVQVLNVETGELSQTDFKFDKEQNAFHKTTGSPKALRIQLSPSRKFQPTDATTAILEELGAPFTHPTRDELKLSDVYVEPEFSTFTVDDKPLATVKSKEIYDQIAALGYLVVRGDEHHGKTSFLSQLFSRSLLNNLVPIRMTAKELATGSEERRDKLLEDRVVEHYGADAVGNYRSLSRDQKLVLVDDLDHLGMNAGQYERALAFIRRSFDHAVLTVSERFDVSLLGSTKVASDLSGYDEYRLLGFTYAMRSELIQRWYALDASLEKAQIEAKVHEAQTQIDYAISKALVPSTAFNTLMLLNALQTTQKGQVVDAGVAQHYDSLIRRRLADSGTAAKEIDGVYAYLSHMAWWMRTRDITTLDGAELSLFNKQFSDEIHPIRADHTLNLLEKARILSLADGAYQFRHPSARYFFLAHYIAEHSEIESVKHHAISACRRLYKRDNANLVVFLASKVGAGWIVSEVAGVLADLLKNVPTFSVVADSRTLNSWVSETAKLAIEVDGDQQENRRQQRERSEQAQADEDKRAEVADVENVSQLDVFTQINLVFKTSEILGLILKSKYGSLDSRTKNFILQQLFDGPLRAISYFLSAINDQPKALIEYLSNSWAEKMPHLSFEQRSKLVQKYLYFALGAYSQALLQRQGEIAGSPDLTSYVTNLLERAKESESVEGTPAGTLLTYRLLGVATRLSYPGDVPFSEIERVARDLKGNPFGFTLLQGLVANHLYMFPVTYDSRQKLAKAVDLDLQTQLAREVNSADAKAIPSRTFKRRNAQSLLSRLTSSFLTRNKVLMDQIGEKKKPEKLAEPDEPPLN